MLKNYFRIAWRNLIKNRQFAILNLVGLSTGLACVILIYIWISDERQVDKFNANDSRLYQVLHNTTTTERIETIENTPGLLANALAKELPEVEYAASVIPATWFGNKGLFSFNDTHIRTDAQFVSKDYFKLFSCRFIAGDEKQLASDRYNIAISKELAQKLFNTTAGVIGKTIEWNEEGFNGTYSIVGVFEKFPANATAQFDALLNYDLFLEKNPKLQKWTNSDPSTFLLLRKGTNVDQFNKKIQGFLKSKNDKSTATLFVQRYSDKYLYNRYENGEVAGGRIEYVKLFSVIAIFILLIACINFMNLSTAKAVKRIKEVGIQKVLGARRRSLILQYTGEALLMAFASLIVAVVLVILLFPAFKEITGKNFELRPSWNFIFSALGITFFTGIVAGSYPAFYVSRFQPAQVLKGTLKNPTGELWVRKGLVVFQFIISIVLIVSVLVVYQQMKLIRNINLGYNRDHLIYFEKGGTLSDDKDYYKPGGGYEKELETFLQRLKNIPGVVNASNFRHNVLNRHGGTTAVTWQGKSPNDQTAFTDIAAGYDFIETLGIEMAAGRPYSSDFGSEKSKVIFNEAALESMGLKNPIGKTVNIWGEDKQIIGVTKNFHFEPLYETIKPCFFDFSLNQRASKIVVRIKAGTEKATLGKLEQFYKAYSGEVLDYKFMDDDYNALYAAEQRVAVLCRYFAGMAILISCLGLFGLVAFIAQKRQKEIGIRKVIGASVIQVVNMLSKDFLLLVVIALCIALPVAWWASRQWLQNFAYRADLSGDIFLITAVSVLLITLLTVSFQAIKAAVANPVKSLRTE